ncbi:SP_0009 family protein [Streptococcus himalayensis]|nr:SP_0009 family protein [Streptococcus himalayensis]
MEDILKTVETFLSYSDEKLEELSQKNQALKEQFGHKEGEKDA